jgi:hypothetical protein
MESTLHDLIDNVYSLVTDAAVALGTEQGRRQAALAIGALAMAAALRLSLRLGWAGLRRLVVREESPLLKKLREHLRDPNATLCVRVEKAGRDAPFERWRELKGCGVAFRLFTDAYDRLVGVKAIIAADGRDVYPDLDSREKRKVEAACAAALARVQARDLEESRRKSLAALNRG